LEYPGAFVLMFRNKNGFPPKQLNLRENCKEMRGSFRRTYHPLRKGNYRAIFFFDGEARGGIQVMGVKSVRFNSDEEKALWELYEDVQDRAVIEDFEVREDAGDTGFAPIDAFFDRPDS
jgi:hypothetical protein